VLLGTVVGRNWSGAPNNPCRVKTIPRPIPEKKWYLTPSVISLMGGLLPFGSIFIEMYFVFTSFWNYKVKKVYVGACSTTQKLPFTPITAICGRYALVS
jgi:transmembrane 9 superfamily protein 3